MPGARRPLGGNPGHGRVLAMFGSIGGAEILMILVLALLLFGPRRLPQIGKTVGRAMSEFRRATQEFRSSLEQEVEADGSMSQTAQQLKDVGREFSDAVRSVDPRSLARDVIARGTPPPPRKPRADSEAAPAAATQSPTEQTPADTEAGTPEPQPATADEPASSTPTPNAAEDKRS